MPILTRRNPERRPGETLYVGDDITVTVLGFTGNQVRIGVQAPKNVEVDREEIRGRKRQEPRSRPNHE